ncbi:MAG: prepilin peptidase [Candidatus Pacebacteria bacterium]|nr:prepilin peptidase [Candidatus Paceibacterota bacterium]
MNIILAFFGGLIYGSFLNVLLWRLPEGRGVNGRSRCRSCNHQLAWYDLVPVLSYLVLGGRCRYCHERIHHRYPIVEITTALILGIFFIIRIPVLSIASGVDIFGLLILVSFFFFDLFYMLLPDVLMFPAMGVYLAYDLVTKQDPMTYVLAALLTASFFAILYAASKGRGLGFGDVKLGLLLGLMLGYPTGFISVVLGIWIAAIVSIGLLLSGKYSRTDAIPLGSFLAFSAIIIIIFYHEIPRFVYHLF